MLPHPPGKFQSLFFSFLFLCKYSLPPFCSFLETIPLPVQHIKIYPFFNKGHWIDGSNNMHCRPGFLGRSRWLFWAHPFNSYISRSYSYYPKRYHEYTTFQAKWKMKFDFRWRRTIHRSLNVIVTFDDLFSLWIEMCQQTRFWIPLTFLPLFSCTETKWFSSPASAGDANRDVLRRKNFWWFLHSAFSPLWVPHAFSE